MTDVFADIELDEADPATSIEDPDTGRTASFMNGNHRYALPWPDGRHKNNGWMRMTNLAGAISDQRQLQEWELRTQLIGIHRRPDVIDQLIAEPLDTLSTEERRTLLSTYAATLKDIGGGNVGAASGNHRHAAVEAEHAGVPLNLRPRIRAKVDNYLSALATAGLHAVPNMQERIVHLPAYEVCGKIDNVLWDGPWGVHRIADLKTQRAFYSWLEIVIQLKGYADSPLMWEGSPTGGKWIDFPYAIDPSTAIVAWMPAEHETDADQVDIYEVEIWHGRRLLDLAYEVVKERAAAKSKTTQWAQVRTTSFAGVTEAWSKRIAETTCEDELRACVAGAKAAGVFDVLRDQATDRLKIFRQAS